MPEETPKPHAELVYNDKNTTRRYKISGLPYGHKTEESIEAARAVLPKIGDKHSDEHADRKVTSVRIDPISVGVADATIVYGGEDATETASPIVPVVALSQSGQFVQDAPAATESH